MILFVASIAGLTFVSMTIFFNKKLQAHPQPLIAYICIAEALMAYNALLQVINPVWVSCYFGFDQILAWSLFNYAPTFDELWNYLNALCWSNSNFFLFFQTFSLLLNLFLCIDLIMTMFSPFKPASLRVKWYLMFSICTPLIFVIAVLIFQDTGNNTNCIDTFYNPESVSDSLSNINNI